MRKWALLSMLIAAPAVAQQQSTPSGHINYGGTKTISCLQAGAVIIQYTKVWGVDLTWSRDQTAIHFAMPDGAPKDLNYNSANMTCLIEDIGQETVPIKKR